METSKTEKVEDKIENNSTKISVPHRSSHV